MHEFIWISCQDDVWLFLFFSHEDGTVRFWDASGVSLKPLYKLSTANIFQTDCDHNDSLTQAGEEEWPPFRKVRDYSGVLMIFFIHFKSKAITSSEHWDICYDVILFYFTPFSVTTRAALALQVS